MDSTQAAPRLIDLSHAISDGVATYPGLPPPAVREHLSRADSRRYYAGGTEFLISRIELIGNTGTYLDAPFHRFPGGTDLAELPLERIAHLEALVVRARDRSGRAIDRDRFEPVDVRGKAVLVDSGWDSHWGTDRYFNGNPFLTRDAAEYLVEQCAVLVGIDSLNIDDIEDLTRPVHTRLLAASIPIVEDLCRLGELPDDGFRFSAVPVKVRRCGAFPVRAFAVVGG